MADRGDVGGLTRTGLDLINYGLYCDWPGTMRIILPFIYPFVRSAGKVNGRLCGAKGLLR